MSKKIKGYKGFDKDFKCRGFQYKENETYEMKEDPKVCNTGFHFCEHPLDVFGYYPPSSSRFAEVTGEGKSDKQEGGDSKVSVSKIHIGGELKLSKLIEAAIKFTFDKVDWIKGEHAKIDQGAASATGTQGAASATGTQGAASATGYQGAAVSLGIEAKAKGIKGCWITLAEWKYTNKWERVDVQTAIVDGNKIKEDVFYVLKDGKFIEA